MPLQDATDYQFATASRRLLVRQAPAGVDLAEAARRHAEQLTTLLGATEVRTSAPGTTAHGATAVTVSATLPDEAAADRAPRVVRTAFLRFPAGPLAELTLHAPATDAGAEAEFRRLLDSVRPAAAGPLDGVGRSLAAAPSGHADYPAGSVRVDLTPDYHGPTTFLLTSPDGRQRYYLERAAADETGTRAAATGTLLGAGTAVARSEDGRPVRYEAGVRPRLSPGRRAPAPTAAESFDLLRGAAGGAPAAGPGQAVVEGRVRGAPVRVRVTAPAEQDNPRELGEQLLRELNQ